MQQVKGNLFDFVGQHAAGVDGGVDEVNVDQVLTAGTRYVVAGRRLFTSGDNTKEAQRSIR